MNHTPFFPPTRAVKLCYAMLAIPYPHPTKYSHEDLYLLDHVGVGPYVTTTWLGFYVGDLVIISVILIIVTHGKRV